jgi:hypothetical protein
MNPVIWTFSHRMKQIGLTEFLNCRAVGGLDEKRAADRARPAVGLEQARHDDSHAVFPGE